MVVIFDSVDAIGKSTQVEKLTNWAHKNYRVVHTLHYSNIKGFPDNETVRDFSVKQYASIFNFIKNVADKSEDLYIYDRCMLSEYVYSPLYRNYDGYYVFALEREIADCNNTILISFTDNVDNIIERDKKRNDGQSFSLDKNAKVEELKKFKEAFDLSNIKNKLMINIENKSIEQVHKEVVDFIDSIGNL